jgi:hypothetical protein
MTILMRCTEPHWQGNKFVARGTVLPAGHPDVIPEYFEVYDVGGEAEPKPAVHRPQITKPTRK